VELEAEEEVAMVAEGGTVVAVVGDLSCRVVKHSLLAVLLQHLSHQVNRALVFDLILSLCLSLASISLCLCLPSSLLALFLSVSSLAATRNTLTIGPKDETSDIAPLVGCSPSLPLISP
jgi:hypothetical protein